MIPASDRWGPFADALEPGERIARIRCLTAITHLSCGPRGVELVGLLKRAEGDAGALPQALAALNGLASLDRRRVLASYAAINRPACRSRGPSNAEHRS